MLATWVALVIACSPGSTECTASVEGDRMPSLSLCLIEIERIARRAYPVRVLSATCEERK